MFTGNENQTITLAEGSDLTENYRNANPGQILGHYFGKSILEEILNQSGCVGIRAYYANQNDGSKELVICGVDVNGNDLYEGLIGDKSFKSPPYSSSPNPLNS